MTARWRQAPRTELLAALADGTLTESHFYEAKRELGATPSARRETARDLAAFAVDGGVLVVGGDEDKTTGRFTGYPGPVAGQAERLEQVAMSLADPPIEIAVAVISTSHDATQGYLVVEIPASPLGPHMVDGRYWGRGDKTKRALSDPEVLRLHERRQITVDRVDALLDAETPNRLLDARTRPPTSARSRP